MLFNIKKVIALALVFCLTKNFNSNVSAYEFSTAKTKESIIEQNRKSVFWGVSDIELIKAISLNETQRAKDIIAKGEYINLVDANGRSALHYAARMNNLELVAMLVKKGARVDLKDRFSQTPLMYSVGENVIDFLIANGASLDFAEVNRKNANGHSLLKAAVIQDSVKDVKVLLRHGAYVNIIDRLGRTPLFFCKSRDVALALLKYGANMNVIDFRYKTVFENLVETNNISVLDFLVLKNGGPRNLSFISSMGMISKSMNNVEMFKHICDDFKLVRWNNSQFNIDLLSLAIERKNVEIIDFILEKGIDVNLFNGSGDTLLHVAIRNSDLDSVKKFLSRGAKMKFPNIQGELPISEVRSISFFDKLVEAGIAQKKDLRKTNLPPPPPKKMDDE